jgi:hypothetical protein
MNTPAGRALIVHRFMGLCGLMGALLFFAGDMLFYGYFGSGAGFEEGMRRTVMQGAPGRLVAGGAIGPAAACLCIVGFWHVYRNVRPASRIWGQVMFGAFFALMVTGSAVHTLWTARGLALKYCGGGSGPCSDLHSAIRSYWGLMYQIGAAPGYLGAVILLGLVLMRKTWYPRWTVLANPAVLILLSPLATMVPAPLGSVIVGGSTNLSIAVFFFVSVATSWRRHSDA